MLEKIVAQSDSVKFSIVNRRGLPALPSIHTFELPGIPARRSTVESKRPTLIQAPKRTAQPRSAPKPEGLRRDLVKRIEAVERATTSEEKATSLERLAEFLFGTVPSLRCKYRNLLTRSSEIDLVVEYDRSRQPRLALFEDLGRYALIECKNWSNPVGASTIRDFMGKMKKSKVRLGIVFSRNGITGAYAGTDALLEIHSLFQQDGVYLLVLSLEELRKIRSGEQFCEALDAKADRLRFDATALCAPSVK